jgi:PPOX class probable F420-dependent enzyme
MSPVGLTPLARRLIDDGEFGVLSTSNVDGTHHLCVMWVGHDGDDVTLASRQGRRQVANAAARPAASVLLYARGRPTEYVEIRGAVSVEPDRRGALVDALARRYTSAPHVGLDPDRDTDRVVLRLVPDVVSDHGARV